MAIEIGRDDREILSAVHDGALPRLGCGDLPCRKTLFELRHDLSSQDADRAYLYVRQLPRLVVEHTQRPDWKSVVRL